MRLRFPGAGAIGHCSIARRSSRSRQFWYCGNRSSSRRGEKNSSSGAGDRTSCTNTELVITACIGYHVVSESNKTPWSCTHAKLVNYACRDEQVESELNMKGPDKLVAHAVGRVKTERRSMRRAWRVVHVPCTQTLLAVTAA
jgi:hypothetical protein